MASPRNSSKSSDNGSERYRLELVGLTSGADRPDITIQAVDAKGEVLSAQKVEQDGGFTLSQDVLGRAATIVVGASDDKEGVKGEGGLPFGGRFSGTGRERRAGVGRTGLVALPFPVGLRQRQGAGVLAPALVVRQHHHRRDRGQGRGRRRRAACPQSRERAGDSQERNSPSLSDLIAWPVRCCDGVPRQRRGLSSHLLLLADRLRRSAHRRPDPRSRSLRRAAAQAAAEARLPAAAAPRRSARDAVLQGRRAQRAGAERDPGPVRAARHAASSKRRSTSTRAPICSIGCAPAAARARSRAGRSSPTAASTSAGASRCTCCCRTATSSTPTSSSRRSAAARRRSTTAWRQAPGTPPATIRR